jgi:uncharacterized membrane protein YkvA (DUF1232 family)
VKKTIRYIKYRTKEEINVLLCLKNIKKIPLISKIFIVIAIAYALSPIDIIPDFIPIIGLLDDLLIIPLLIGLSYLFIPRYILKECRKTVRREFI